MPPHDDKRRLRKL